MLLARLARAASPAVAVAAATAGRAAAVVAGVRPAPAARWLSSDGSGAGEDGQKRAFEQVLPLYEAPETIADEGRHVIVALVANESGVLANISGMFAARNFNIDSLVVGRTQYESLSRMTITLKGSRRVLKQLKRQMTALPIVWKVVDYQPGSFIERDLIMVKVHTEDASKRREIKELMELFEANVADLSSTMITIQLMANPTKCEAFIDLLKPYGIAELARTGVIGMSKNWLPPKEDAEASFEVDPRLLPPG